MAQKPIKRNVHIVQLSRDHHFALMFCWKIRNGLKLQASPERIKKYVAYFWQAHMQPHFHAEETILFRPVHDAAVQKALDEHIEIKQQIDGLQTADSNAAELLLALADTVDNHVRYEERELFPQLERMLSDEQLENIGKQINAQHGTEIKDDFADDFWVKPK